MKPELLLCQVSEGDDIETLRPGLTRALEDIHARSGGRYSTAVVLDYIKQRVSQPDTFALMLALDRDQLRTTGDWNAALAGVMTLELCGDEVGRPFVFISRGWTRPGSAGAPFDAVLPTVERWGRARGAKVIRSGTERCSRGQNAERLSLSRWLERMRGLWAYAHWIGKRGFVMRETTFEMELPT